jgi:hypothetical protein
MFVLGRNLFRKRFLKNGYQKTHYQWIQKRHMSCREDEPLNDLNWPLIVGAIIFVKHWE